jgi:hypothetical protein
MRRWHMTEKTREPEKNVTNTRNLAMWGQALITVALAANLLLLMLANEHPTWNLAITVLPWAWVLCTHALRRSTLHIVLSYKLLTITSVALTLLIALGCTQYQCGDHLDALWPPILWIPVAAITLSDRTQVSRLVFYTLATAVTFLTVVIFLQFWVEGAARPRGLSFNVLTGPMIMAMVCLLGAMHADKAQPTSTKQNWIFWTVSLIGLAGAICSQSRTALLAYIVASTLYLWRTPRQQLKQGAVILFILAIWTFTQVNRYHEGQAEMAKLKTGQHVHSIGERSDGLRWSREHFWDSPWLGMGAEKLQQGFKNRGIEWGRENPRYPFLHHVHNDYLQMGLEHGIPALCAFIGMWWLLARRTIRHQNETMGKGLADNVPPWLLAMIGVYVSAFLTDSFTYWIFTWATVSACFGVAAGLMTGQAARSSNTAAPI